jgi:signal peptidase I
LIGLENDTIQIRPPHVLVNGEILDSRPAFERIYSRTNGYNGYVIPQTFPPPTYLSSPSRTYTVPEKHLFVLGDNSMSSLDGRFWGSLPQKDLVGRAILVYWPFSDRFGRID